MSPEELPQQPGPGRAPYVRRPVSVDGISPRPIQRPVMPVRAGMRPPLPTQRPMPTPSPPPQYRPPVSIPAQSPAAAPTSVPPSLPQPASTAPVSTATPPTPTPVPVLTPAPAPAPTSAPVPPVQPAPRVPKRWRKGLLLVGSGLLVLAILAAGTATWLHWQAQRNDPDRIFQEALQLSLSAKKLHAETVSATGRSQVDYDFSNSADPTISSDTTLQITGENFGVAGYGTSRDSFISYTKLPDFITPDLAATVGGSWVQLRQEGRLPTGVSSTLANLADPRYQAFGPLILGNYAPKTRQELINFMLANRIYAYNNTGVTKQTLGDSSVLVYTAKLNTNYLKIANQSAAANLKFQPEEIKAAIDALDQIKDKRLILYVTAADHRIKQLQFNGLDGRTKITYSQYDQAELPGEPQTKVVWKNFSPAYSQITAQITAYQAKNLTKAQH